MGWGSWLGSGGPMSPCHEHTSVCVCPFVWAEGAKLPPDSQEGVPDPGIKKPCSRVCPHPFSGLPSLKRPFTKVHSAPGQGQGRLGGGVRGGAGPQSSLGIVGMEGIHHCPLLPCIHSGSQYFFELSQYVAPPHPRQGCEGLGRKSPPTFLHLSESGPSGKYTALPRVPG